MWARSALRAGSWRSLRAKIALLLLVPLATVVVTAGVSLAGTARTSEQSGAIYQNTLDMRAGIDALDAANEGYETALMMIFTIDPAEQRRLNVRIIEHLIPRFERILSSGAQAEEAHLREDIQSLESGWRVFLQQWRSGEYATDPDRPRDARRNSELAIQTKAIFEPMKATAKELTDEETREAAESHQTVEETGSRMLTEVVFLILFAGASCIVAMLLLTRNVVGRIRSYSHFAVSVAGGDQTGQLSLRGCDELTDLGAALNELVARQRNADAYEQARNDFVDTLAHAESQDEAQVLVKRQLERTVPGCTATVLNRNNSGNRLEPATDLAAGSNLRSALAEATPRSCLAIRFARQHEGGGERPSLAACSVCSATDRERSTCQPVTVSGEVIGSVLLEHSAGLKDNERSALQETVARAAPVLANQRNLALAEQRANNDALTGLANRRALDHILKRMVAQASRTNQPLAALMLDIDHFKALNDRYGHDKGDEALAAVGAALRGALRGGDFVARYGGEEFAVLLPATDSDAARAVANSLLDTIRLIQVGDVERRLTASIGMAVLPHDAADAGGLLRLADRALYAAKISGRDRVECVASSVMPEVSRILAGDELADDDLPMPVRAT